MRQFSSLFSANAQSIISAFFPTQATKSTFAKRKAGSFQMIRQVGWVLLDCIERAPHEVGRLMSVFEEDRTLPIYEGVQAMFLSNPGSTADTVG
jgi:hypothetical protein